MDRQKNETKERGCIQISSDEIDLRRKNQHSCIRLHKFTNIQVRTHQMIGAEEKSK